MYKKILNIFVIVMLLSLNFDCVLAYDFSNENNKKRVNDMIDEIYDAKEQYEDLAGVYTSTDDVLYNSSNNLYWWPIGSESVEEINGKTFAKGDPTSITITSSFASDEEFRSSPHKGLDIASSKGTVGYDNVIAANSGVVVYPVKKEQTMFQDNGYLGNTDGGGFGNYVVIQHSDGNYTYYGHLAYDSITVTAGDTVERGQVIAKLGHSGNSTGPHLHFEMRTSRSVGTEVNPLNYVNPKEPRPLVASTDGFSLTTTTLTKEEFTSKMKDYCTRTKNSAFCNNFASKAEEIYDASLKNNVNPELVVVTAGTEQGFKSCGTTNNYWGIGISNGKGCSAGPHYSSISEGIAGYANVIASYQEGGSRANFITNTYNSRLKAGADPNGIGLPGTYVGMQMIYSYLGKHEYGSSGAGGFYYMDPDRAGVTTIYKTHTEFLTKCYNAGGEHALGQPVTAWEQSRYTIFQMQGKNNLRQKIFGL